MSDETDPTGIRRRTVLRTVAAAGALAGGIGTASAQHRGQGGPPEGKGPGNDQGSGDEKGNKGENGGGPTHLTGGSGWMPGPYEEIPVDPDPTDGPDARFEIGTSTGRTQYWTGCESVNDPNVPTVDFKVYPVTWLDGSGPSEIYLYNKKPVQPGVYNMVEAYSCPQDGDPGPNARVGYEPGTENEG